MKIYAVSHGYFYEGGTLVENKCYTSKEAAVVRALEFMREEEQREKLNKELDPEDTYPPKAYVLSDEKEYFWSDEFRMVYVKIVELDLDA